MDLTTTNRRLARLIRAMPKSKKRRSLIPSTLFITKGALVNLQRSLDYIVVRLTHIRERGYVHPLELIKDDKDGTPIGQLLREFNEWCRKEAVNPTRPRPAWIDPDEFCRDSTAIPPQPQASSTSHDHLPCPPTKPLQNEAECPLNAPEIIYLKRRRLDDFVEKDVTHTSTSDDGRD